MAERVFIKVVGFSDVERHALNTVFRLSEQRDTVYSLWLPDAPAAPQLALMDGQSYESGVDAQSPDGGDLKLVWVGDAPPPHAWRVFERPIAWPEVVKVMDELFAAQAVDFDLDLGLGEETAAPDTLPPDEPPARRALIASADRNERLYLRAKLALAQLTQADEAETGAQALELTRQHQYELAVMDFALPDLDGWVLLKELASVRPPIPHVIVTKDKPSVPDRVRAWFAGAEGFFDKPPHPGKLQALLQRI